MMNRINMKVFEATKDRSNAIEYRLLQFYIFCQLIWLLFIALACIILKLPAGTRNVYRRSGTVSDFFFNWKNLKSRNSIHKNIFCDCSSY